MIIEIVFGFVLLAAGGDLVVRGAVDMAKRFGVSTLFIGIVLVGFGTSLPELVTSMDAAFVGAPGIVIGNVIGSNIANILLILGLSAALAPFACDMNAFRRDAPVLVGATIAFVAVALTGEIGRMAGFVLVTALILYLGTVYRTEARADGGHQASALDGEELGDAPSPLWLAIVFTIGGFLVTIFGAHMTVSGATDLARGLGVSDALIGLTIVAIGTSLPELAASAMAALRGKAEMAFGNILGSCIFNLLGVLGITALVMPIPVTDVNISYNVLILTGVTALFVVFATTGARLSRWEGLTFLTGYVGYVSLLTTWIIG